MSFVLFSRLFDYFFSLPLSIHQAKNAFQGSGSRGKVTTVKVKDFFPVFSSENSTMSGDSIQGTETVCLFLRADFCCRRVLLDVFDCTVKLLIMGKGWHGVFTRYSQYRNPFFLSLFNQFFPRRNFSFTLMCRASLISIFQLLFPLFSFCSLFFYLPFIHFVRVLMFVLRNHLRQHSEEKQSHYSSEV